MRNMETQALPEIVDQDETVCEVFQEEVQEICSLGGASPVSSPHVEDDIATYHLRPSHAVVLNRRRFFLSFPTHLNFTGHAFPQ